MSYLFMSAFGPSSPFKGLDLSRHVPFLHPFMSNSADGSYSMGADPMAASLIYFGLAYYRLWMVIPALMMVHTGVVGPKMMGGAVTACGAALCL